MNENHSKRLTSRFPEPLISAAVLAGGFFLLLWPLAYTGFPTIYGDTLDYLKLGYDFPKRDIPFRPPTYGLLLVFFEKQISIVAAAVFQAAFLVYWLKLLAESVLDHVSPYKLGILLAVAGLCSGLPWLCNFLMPDVWTVPAAFLPFILYHHRKIGILQRALLLVIFTLLLILHYSFWTLAVGCAFITALLGGLRPDRLLVKRNGVVFLIQILSCVAISMAALTIYHWRIYGVAVLAPTRPIFMLSRLEEDGLVHRYLKSVCPAANLNLCSIAETPVKGAMGFLWHDKSPYVKLRIQLGWKVVAIESKEVAAGVIRAYPLEVTRNALRDTIKQLFTVTSSETGLVLAKKWYYPGTWIRLAPLERFFFANSRQVTEPLPPVSLDRWYQWSYGISTVFLIGALIVALIMRSPGGSRAEIFQFTLCVFVLMLLNAFIAGALSAALPRLGARIAWIIPVTAALSILSWRQCSAAGRDSRQG